MNKKKKSWNPHTGKRMDPGKAAKIKVLLDNGATKTQIARMEGVSRNTVNTLQYEDRFDSKIVERIKKGIAGGFYVIADKALATVSQDKLEKSSAFQLVGMAGLAGDKARLFDGLPTERIEFTQGSPEEIQAKVDALEAEIGLWEAGEVQNADVVPDKPPQGATVSGELAEPDE